MPLTRSGLFHSHLENLQQVPASELQEQVWVKPPALRPLTLPSLCSWAEPMGGGSGCGPCSGLDLGLDPTRINCMWPPQVTLSYGVFENKHNAVHLKGPFSLGADPSR